MGGKIHSDSHNYEQWMIKYKHQMIEFYHAFLRGVPSYLAVSAISR
jgi:hypothetical protein